MEATVDISVTDLTRAIMLLDAAQEALDAAAEREMRREAGKSMRRTTEQNRAQAVREYVAYMKAEFGLEID